MSQLNDVEKIFKALSADNIDIQDGKIIYNYNYRTITKDIRKTHRGKSIKNLLNRLSFLIEQIKDEEENEGNLMSFKKASRICDLSIHDYQLILMIYLLLNSSS